MSSLGDPTSQVEVHLQSCPICKSSPQPWTIKRVEKDNYPIERCSKCGFGFVNPRPSMAFLKAHYSSYGHGKARAQVTLESITALEKADPNSTIDARRMIGTVKKLLKGRSNMSSRLLDIGAGYGFFSREAKENGFQVTAIDLAESERQIAVSVSGIEPLAISFEDLNLELSSMSVILMSQVLEHALAVEAWVEKAWRLLENEGILAIALPNFGSLQRLLLQEKDPYVCPPDHLNFFTPKALTTLLVRTGFKVEAIQHVSRLPRQTFRKHLPGATAGLAPVVAVVANGILKLVDLAGLGSIVNIYARKMAE